jgi:hypothetical protein
MSMPSKYVLLHTETGAANTAFTTPAIDVSDFESIGYRVQLTGGVAPAALIANINGYDTDGVSLVNSKFATVATGAGFYSGSWGTGCGGLGDGDGPTMAAPLPAQITITTPAFGVGITATMSVYGRRTHRGPDISSTAD